MTRVVIAGAAGRMGQLLVRCARATNGIELVGALETAGHAALGTDAGLLAGSGPTGIAIGCDPAAALANADVLIDFTAPAAAPVSAEVVARLGKGLVLGTTGLDAAETAAVRAAAARTPIVWAPNMSLGVNLLFALVERTAALLGPDYDIEIVETHHRHKKDAPSGTALRLAEKAAAGRQQDLGATAVYGRHGLTGARPCGEIGVHAVRSGDVVGDHVVSFGTDGERIELSHRATSRAAFANGALKAALWLAGRPPGLYDMQDVLGL